MNQPVTLAAAPQRAERPWRAVVLLGAGLVGGAPLGLAMAAVMERGQWPTVSRLWAQGASLPFLHLYAAFATLLAVSLMGLGLRRRVRQLDELATTDPLTGLFNRRYLDDRLAEVAGANNRRNHGACLVSLDLDHLKTINDRHGHRAGDDAIHVVSRVLLGGVRDTDVVARVGGDEFAVLMTNTTPAQAQVLCKRILLSLGTHLDPSRVPLGASIGIAALHRGNDLDTVRDAADGALMGVKARGGGYSALAGFPELERSRPMNMQDAARATAGRREPPRVPGRRGAARRVGPRPRALLPARDDGGAAAPVPGTPSPNS